MSQKCKRYILGQWKRIWVKFRWKREREHTHNIHKSDSWSYINKVAQNQKICKEKKSCGLTICHSKMIKDENRKNTRRVMWKIKKMESRKETLIVNMSQNFFFKLEIFEFELYEERRWKKNKKKHFFKNWYLKFINCGFLFLIFVFSHFFLCFYFDKMSKSDHSLSIPSISV